MNKLILMTGLLGVSLAGGLVQNFQTLPPLTTANMCKTQDLTRALPHAQDMEYLLRNQQSSLKWQAAYLAGGGHSGTLRFNDGKVRINAANQITQAEFAIAMHTLQNTDLKSEDGKKDLEAHLKSQDFFAVAKYPEAHFQLLKATYLNTQHLAAVQLGTHYHLDKVEKFKIEGKLTLKGISRDISFVADIKKLAQDQLSIQAEISLDRTLWGINYQNADLLNSVKDGIIANEIKIYLDLLLGQGC
ncbi:MAG: YceI family protein [Microscillaceae bacterium]|jgi:polyisoprenoid-binding protein YceI|nr:YceI family protein [Microscillaceae bacterium]